jgi:hypothetical protein
MSGPFVSLGYSTELAFCSPTGMFLGVSHTWSSCEVALSPLRRNENVFTLSRCPDTSDVTKTHCGNVPLPLAAARLGMSCSLKACNGTFLSAGSLLLEHEREVGTSIRPFPWQIVPCIRGCVVLYSAQHGALLRNDLSMHKVPELEEPNADMEAIVTAEEDRSTAPSSLWLAIPVPLKSVDLEADGYYSVTRLLCWGHDSAVLLTEHSSLREASVVKSIPCERAPAIRRIDALLYALCA